MDNVGQNFQGGNHKQIRLCSINICGLSQRSQHVLDYYTDKEQLDLVAVQESGLNNLHLTNMVTVTDLNKGANRGCALFVRNCYSVTSLDSISEISKNIDTVWALCVFNNKRIIVGTAYLKLGYVNGVKELTSMIDKAKTLSSTMRASGIIVLGDMNSRHPLWGDTTTNDYGKRLMDGMDFHEFSVITTPTPTFISSNGSSYIDLIIASNNMADIIEAPSTDNEVELFSGAPIRGHVPMLCNLDISRPKHNTKSEKMDISNIEWNTWKDDLDSTLKLKLGEGTTEDNLNPAFVWKC